MAYRPDIHHAQMAASKLNEQLLMAMGAEDDRRDWQVREALAEFGKLAERISELDAPTQKSETS